MRLEPALDRRSLVGGVVVDDQMQIEIRQGFLVDALEEPQEFPLPVSGHAFADDRAVKHIQGCEQRGCAMALVVVGHGTGTAPSSAASPVGYDRAPGSGSSHRPTAPGLYQAD